LLTGVALGLGGVVSVGVVTGLGGALTEGAAALVFQQANRAKSDAQANLAAIAEAAERDDSRQMALIYAARISDGALRDSTNADLARQSITQLGVPDS
jgi:hypothetical protein